MPYCPRCGTPLSSHEVAQGYKDVKERSAIAKFKVKGEDAYILAWTTTPWTLPSNVALCVNPNAVSYTHLKALQLNASVISFDEPTASLSDAEVKILFEIIHELKKSGVTILYISHKMDEIFAHCDRATVPVSYTHLVVASFLQFFYIVALFLLKKLFFRKKA